MTNYPYYTVCKVDAGQMVRLAHGKKFENAEDCIDYINKLKTAKIGSYVVKDYQIVVLKYVGSYECKIIYIHQNDKLLKISE